MNNPIKMGTPIFGNTHRVQVSYIPVNIAGLNGWTLKEDVGILLNIGIFQRACSFTGGFSASTQIFWKKLSAEKKLPPQQNDMNQIDSKYGFLTCFPAFFVGPPTTTPSHKAKLGRMFEDFFDLAKGFLTLPMLPLLKLTASLHLKIDGWKTILSFWDGFLAGAKC